jgi:hypothetical protein
MNSCAPKRQPYKSTKMTAMARVLVLTWILLGGCRATRDVVVTSYHVATAPVHLVRRAISADSPPTQSTTSTTTSDVVTPGRPVSVTSSSSSQQQRVASSTTQSRSENAPPKSTGSSPRSTSAQLQFPTAKPVPDRPGLVFNPYDPNGGYIDVSGYASGSKVKDPDSQKIFIVP